MGAKIDKTTGKYVKVKPPKQSRFQWTDASGKRHVVKTWKELPQEVQIKRGYKLSREQIRHNISVGQKKYWQSEKGQKRRKELSEQIKRQGGIRKKQQGGKGERDNGIDYGDDTPGYPLDFIDQLKDEIRTWPDTRYYMGKPLKDLGQWRDTLLALLDAQLAKYGPVYADLLAEKADEISDCFMTISNNSSTVDSVRTALRRLRAIIELRNMTFEENVEETEEQRKTEFLEFDPDYDDDPFPFSFD